MENYKKEWYYAICNNVAGLKGTKWNKSDKERQT